MNLDFAKQVLERCAPETWDLESLCEVAAALTHKNPEELAGPETQIMSIFAKKSHDFTFEEALKFMAAFSTRTGKNRAMITWAETAGFDDTDQVKLFLSKIETEKFFGREAIAAIKKAVEANGKLGIDVDAVHAEMQAERGEVEEMVSGLVSGLVSDLASAFGINPETCLCIGHQLKRMDVNEEAEALIRKQYGDLTAYMEEMSIPLKREDYILEAIETMGVDIDDRTRQIILAQSAELRKECGCARCQLFDMGIDDSERLTAVELEISDFLAYTENCGIRPNDEAAVTWAMDNLKTSKEARTIVFRLAEDFMKNPSIGVTEIKVTSGTGLSSLMEEIGGDLGGAVVVGSGGVLSSIANLFKRG